MKKPSEDVQICPNPALREIFPAWTLRQLAFNYFSKLQKLASLLSSKFPRLDFEQIWTSSDGFKFKLCCLPKVKCLPKLSASVLEERGSAILEMALFMPVLLSLVLLLLDLGYATVSRANLIDALMSGVSQEVVRLAEPIDFASNEFARRRGAQVLADTLMAQVESRLDSSVLSGESISVELSVFQLRFGTTTGEAILSSLEELASASSVFGLSSASLPRQSKFFDKRQWVFEHLSKEKDVLPSHYAIPLGILRASSSNEFSQVRYLDRRLFLHVALFVSSKAGYWEQFFGKSRDSFEQVLMPIRGDLN